MHRRHLLLFLPVLTATALLPAAPSPAMAEDTPEITLTFLGDRFEPAEVPVPANVKFALRVVNKSTVSMEFESKALHREKLVPPGKEARIFIGPVKAGTYEFFDDFHPKIRGNLVAR